MKTTKVILGLIIYLPINIPLTYSQDNQNVKVGSIGINYLNDSEKIKSFILLPDLQCSYFWWKSETVMEGAIFWVTVKVNNAGNGSAGPSHVNAYLSTDNDWDLSDDHFLGKQSVDSLAPGAYDSIHWDFNFPDIGSGSFPVWIVAISDCDHEVIESEENNTWRCNCSFKVYEPPDLLINPDIVDIYEIGDVYISAGPDNTESKEKCLYQTFPGTEYVPGLIIPENVKEYGRNQTPKIGYCVNELMDSIDWSSFDSPVKNQALNMCASCWVFASVALVENLSNHTDLSEQVVLSCADTGGCNGGWTGEALRYIGEFGVPHEGCYPYTGNDGLCSDKCTDQIFLVKICEYDYYPRWYEPTGNTINDLKVLLQVGPVVVSMIVPDDNTFKGSPGYIGGIYDYNGGIIANKIKHAVLVAGYNDYGQFFRVKNSWGPFWGEKGYFRIAYNDVMDDVHFGGYACTASGVYTKRDGDDFSLSNIGGSTLKIADISSTKSWLKFNPNVQSALNILPGGSVTIDCVVDWNNVLHPSEKAIVTINSNDPYESRIELEVIGIPMPVTTTVNGPNTMDLWKTDIYNNIFIYPNPADNIINIKIGNIGEQDIEIELLNVSGQIIYSKEYKTSTDPFVKQIDLSGYEKGVYFLWIRQAGAVYTGKIVVQ